MISREDGSGTRGAFIELTGVEEKNDAGEKMDMTTEAAAIQSSTNGVMTAVANDETAIGYISLGLSERPPSRPSPWAAWKPLPRMFPTVLTPWPVPSTSLPTVRPTDAVAVDFIAYCMSPDGQALATEEGYIGGEGTEFTSTQPSGSITVGGSSSVSPLMEKLIEALQDRQPQRHH